MTNYSLINSQLVDYSFVLTVVCYKFVLLEILIIKNGRINDFDAGRFRSMDSPVKFVLRAGSLWNVVNGTAGKPDESGNGSNKWIATDAKVQRA